MTRKFKFFLFFFIFLFIFIVLGAISVEKKNTSSFIQLIESKLPEKIKVMLKQTVFSIPTLNRKTQQHENIIYELDSKITVLTKRVESLHAGVERVLPGSELNDIKSKSNIYNIRTFLLPFPNNHKWMMKAVAYLEQTNNEIIIASGHGEFFSFKKKDIGSDDLELTKIKSFRIKLFN